MKKIVKNVSPEPSVLFFSSNSPKAKNFDLHLDKKRKQQIPKVMKLEPEHVWLVTNNKKQKHFKLIILCTNNHQEASANKVNV